MLVDNHHLGSRRCFLALCAGLITGTAVGGADTADSAQPARSSSANNPAGLESNSPEVSLKGKLKGGLVGIGGETTGYALMEPRLASNTIEVDMSAVKEADKLDGKDLVLTGSFQTKEYVERGRVLIFKVKSARNA